MTNKEAKKYLHIMKTIRETEEHPTSTTVLEIQVLDLAIKALENEIEKEECIKIGSLSELGFQDFNDGIVDPIYIDDGVDCSDMGIFSWGDS